MTTGLLASQHCLLCIIFFGFPPVLADLSGTSTANAEETKLPTSAIPAGLIYENRKNPYLFWVELEAGKLHLLERVDEGRYVSKSTQPISLGKNGIGKEAEGDGKTPLGVYQFTSHLDDKYLDDYYGVGAYPVNFPNVWDRIRNRTGHGIWLHGLPKGVKSRPTRDSEGCVVIDNDSMKQMGAYITVGESLFVLSTSLDWLPGGAKQSASDILDSIEHWRQSWEANKAETYLANYHPDFTDTRRDLQEWSIYKRRVNSTKSFIKIDISEMSVIEYPGEENLVAVRFYQRYESSNFNWQGWKHLLWRRDDGGDWRILYEGNG